MVSHEHKCIFIHIPKTGGQSVENVFLNSIGLTWKTRAPLLLHANAEESIGPQRLEHLKASEYTQHHYVSEELFNNYFKFSIVRDPWSRMFSFYKFHGYALLTDFKTYVMKYFMKDPWNRVQYFVCPQVEYLYDNDNNLLVDYIVRFENMDEDFKKVSDKFAFGLDKLPLINKSIPNQNRFYKKAEKLVQRFPELKIEDNTENLKSDYRANYDDEIKEFVAEIYKKDIEAFNYTF